MKGVATQEVKTGASTDVMAGFKRAAIYVRVSSEQQVNRNRRGDDGYSIPAQTQACQAKAEELGAVVVSEYVERAESARTDDRPELQRLLERLESMQDIDYVIVHKVDRWARNRHEEAMIHFRLKQAGAQLVSVSENIDDTPSGMLVHGIMATIAEFYSNNLAGEIRKGLAAKAQAGGTLGRAPIGYVNKREISGKRDVRWAEPDPERAEHVRWAFEAYASGDYSLNRLTDALAARGLRTIETARCESRSLYKAHVHKMLTNPYYVGIIRYKGANYPGEHEPLVDFETFARVQALLNSRCNGEKQRAHPHYLRSTLYCATCGSRIAFTRAVGNGGSYDYFFCLGRHQKRTTCTMPYVPAEQVENLVEAYYRDHVNLPTDLATTLRDKLAEALKGANQAAEREAREQTKRIQSLKNRQQKLLDGYEFGSLTKEQLKDRQDRIEAELVDAKKRSELANIKWATIEDNLAAAYELAADCAETYQQAKPARRRLLNQAFFTRILIHADPDTRTPEVAKAELQPLFEKLLDPALPARLGVPGRRQGRRTRETSNREPVSVAHGLKENDLVELGRLELPTSCMPCKRSSQLSYSPESTNYTFLT